MKADDHAGIARHVEGRLRATLMSGDRLFPITVTDLSEDGFAAEGVALDGLDEDVLLEMTLPPVGEVTWSPKVAASAPRGAPPSRVRVRARLGHRTPVERGLDVVQGLVGVFDDMSESCRNALRRWLAKSAHDGQPITRGIGPRRPAST